jgi:hypothetical protein
MYPNDSLEGCGEWNRCFGLTDTKSLLIVDYNYEDLFQINPRTPCLGIWSFFKSC